MKFIEVSAATGKLYIAVDKIHAIQPDGYPERATRIFTGSGENDYWTAYETTSEILERIDRLTEEELRTRIDNEKLLLTALHNRLKRLTREESLAFPMPPAETANPCPHAPSADVSPEVTENS